MTQPTASQILRVQLFVASFTASMITREGILIEGMHKGQPFKAYGIVNEIKAEGGFGCFLVTTTDGYQIFVRAPR